MARRDANGLNSEMREKYRMFCQEMDKAGIPWICTCTRRTQAEQDALYAQGRSKPGPIVTWTRQSKHIDGKAFDIVLLRNGKINWDIGDPAWKKAGEIGRKIGLNWGGSWARTKDFPHFELNGKATA